jgi:ABC-2 type transport system ATP-binding protein
MQITASPTETTTLPLIKIQHVSKRYRNVNALQDFSLEIPRGTIYGLIGPNGAGKTTLMRILAALIAPSSGQVWLDNKEVTRTPTTIQRKVGYMPDFFGVYPDLTSAEYLEFYAGIHGISRSKRATIVKDLLELVELSSKRDALVEGLSRGMKQRLCLARALVHDPEVLILDEPASGLDPRARVELRELVRTLQSLGKTVIISSHILLELAEMCTNIAIMQAGQLIIAGDVETIIQGGGIEAGTNLGSTAPTLRPYGRQIEIRLLDAQYVNQAIEIIKAAPDTSNVLPDDNDPQVIKADFSGDNQSLHSILARLITESMPVVSFAPRTGGGRLEEVFMQITERGGNQS